MFCSSKYLAPPVEPDEYLCFSISHNVDVVYLAAYNFDDVPASIAVDILTTNTTTKSENPIPIPCGMNAECDHGLCECHVGYRGDPYIICNYDLCNNVQCEDQETCNSNTGKCECRDGYAKINGHCVPPLCPTEPIIATENQFGYAMGEISSPFYGEENYPHNFDCTYEIDAPRAVGSCYEIHIETPFSLETSRACQHDRVELYNIQNPMVITMDHAFTAASNNTAAVLCGNGKFKKLA